MSNIPEEIKKEIDSKYSYKSADGDYVAFSYKSYNQSMDDRRIGAEFGYGLAAEQLAAKEKDIERLKGLIEMVFKSTGLENDFKELLWEQFKTENNL